VLAVACPVLARLEQRKAMSGEPLPKVACPAQLSVVATQKLEAVVAQTLEEAWKLEISEDRHPHYKKIASTPLS